MPEYKRPESVLVVVHTADGEVLLLRRADVPDFWQSVTGSVREGETPIEAARRELEEETGLDGSGIVDCHRRQRFRIAPEWRARYAPGATHNLEHQFRLGVPVRQKIRLNPAEHTEAAWLDMPEAAERATSWTNAAAIRSLDSDPGKTTVVLVHGLWIGPRSVSLIARRLRRFGFNVAVFAWQSTREAPDAAAERLAGQLREVGGEILHFVGHSMGGMVIAHLLMTHRPARVGRVVLLGSPLAGSEAGRDVIDRRLGAILGAAAEPLHGGGFEWPRDVPLAIIAGVNRCGPGNILSTLPRPNDGTVTVEETRVRGVTPRLINVTHLGLLTSREVLRETAIFLRDGALPRRQG